MEHCCEEPPFTSEVTQMVKERNCLDLVLKRVGCVGIFSLAVRGARPIVASANLRGICNVYDLAGELREMVKEDYPTAKEKTIRIFEISEESRNQLIHLATITPESNQG